MGIDDSDTFNAANTPILPSNQQQIAQNVIKNTKIKSNAENTISHTKSNRIQKAKQKRSKNPVPY